MRASRMFLAPSRPRSLMRRGRMGHRVTHPHPASTRGLQGGFGMGRVEVPPHPSATRGSRVLQGRVWGSRAQQLSLWCRHRGSQGLLPWVRERAPHRWSVLRKQARPCWEGGWRGVRDITHPTALSSEGNAGPPETLPEAVKELQWELGPLNHCPHTKSATGCDGRSCLPTPQSILLNAGMGFRQ